MSQMGKQIKKAMKASLKTPQAKRDRISNRKGLIEGVDSESAWHNTRHGFESLERIGTRRKV